MARSAICVFLTLFLLGKTYEHKVQKCQCLCSVHEVKSICEHFNDLKLEVDVNTEELKKWAQLFPFVQHLQNQWRDEIVSIVETQMKKYGIRGDELLPKPESLMAESEEMMNDSSMVSKHTETDEVLAKNVSSLLRKVEMVENRTIEVEEELKSERRVRRHLEEDLKETQSSLESLGDQLQNVTVPVETLMNHVQMVIISSLEDMNKTLYEDHLQKLYYKVDGVVYQNETRKLDDRLWHVESELHDGENTSLVAKLAEDVKLLEENLVVLNTSIGNDLTPRLSSLEASNDAVAGLEGKMEEILNSTEQFKDGLVHIWTDLQDVRRFQEKLQNFTEEWSNSLKHLETQLEILKNETSGNSDDPSFGETEDIVVFHNYTQVHNVVENFIKTVGDVFADEESVNVTDVADPVTNNETENEAFDQSTEPLLDEFDTEYSDATTLDILDTFNLLQTTEEPDVSGPPCEVPVANDPQLLIDLETDPAGKQSLKFGCRTIGQYAITSAPVPVQCRNGTWTGPFPSCQELPDEAAIQDIAEQMKWQNPCLGRSGDFPDPSDCSRFLKCSHGLTIVVKCPNSLHFNPLLKICDYPYVSKCAPLETGTVQDLKNMIPPILIDPGNLDRPNSLLGTGTSGQLVVHPRSSFRLHCLYPESVWGVPSWKVTIAKSSVVQPPVSQGQNRATLTVTAAREEDSGTYKCATPFGKEHAIRVDVKAVHCPPISLGDEYDEVYYRPTPEGEQRILSTTAEIQCEGGGRATVVCMANGKWSKIPDAEKCILKKRQALGNWNCQPLEPNNDSNLILERNDVEKIVIFKCAGRMRLIGNSFTRCRDDGLWSHASLPKCIQ